MNTKEEKIELMRVNCLISEFIINRIKANKKETEIRKAEAKEEKIFFKDIRTHIDKLIAKVHEAEQTQATQCHYCKETSKLEVFTKNKEEVKVCEDCYFGSECELK